MNESRLPISSRVHQWWRLRKYKHLRKLALKGKAYRVY